MSRCFPYPPPGYSRNGGGAPHQALIDSIKLQKETDKAKAERRKEKKLKKEKKEKKKEEKEKRKNEEKLKSQKNQSEVSHKLLQKEAGITEAEINGKKPNTEVLEKSDLTEESGQPIKPSYSSDSTQNSNKRRRDDNDNDDVLLHDDSAGHGKHIKIRLLKKLKESDPTTSSGEDARLKTVSIPPPRRENNAAQRAPSTQTKSNGLRLSREPSPSSSAKPILPPVSRKSGAEALKPGSSLSRQQLLQQQQKHQQIASFARPVVSESQLKHDIPSSSASRNIGVQGPNSARLGLVQSKPSPITTGKRPINEIPVAGNISFQSKPSPITTGKRPVNEIPAPGNISLLNKPSPITTGKRPVNEIPVSANISLLNKPSSIATGKRPINDAPVPGTSGPTSLGKRKEGSEKPGPSRAEKKMMKKHAKYEKLIGSWVPPPAFQALLPQVVNDEEDWLPRRIKPANSLVSKGEVETCGAGETGLWQPRARFLPEADIHALPYTIPF
ncbi:uncharacterized protein LOC143581245 [Bidens hawaiensis]|uniref:uncharacterized protein LOC143581245 n=1 Tax=Bidens hawaiensis TaxID=980011 RepID=UPI00404A089C